MRVKRWRPTNDGSSGERRPVWVSPGVHVSNHAAGDVRGRERGRGLRWGRFSLQELDKCL